jgi:hypothetical protein
LCNVATNATRLARDVADVVLGNRLRPDAPSHMVADAERVETNRSVRELEPYTGRYASDEVEVEMTAAVEGGRLVLKRRFGNVVPLTPFEADTFGAGSLGLVVFHRDASKRVIGFSVVQERVWDLVFEKK